MFFLLPADVLQRGELKRVEVAAELDVLSEKCLASAWLEFSSHLIQILAVHGNGSELAAQHAGASSRVLISHIN